MSLFSSWGDVGSFSAVIQGQRKWDPQDDRKHIQCLFPPQNLEVRPLWKWMSPDSDKNQSIPEWHILHVGWFKTTTNPLRNALMLGYCIPSNGFTQFESRDLYCWISRCWDTKNSFSGAEPYSSMNEDHTLPQSIMVLEPRRLGCQNILAA